MFPDHIAALAAEVVRRSQASGLMVATAESCTGGLIAGALTAVAGSSVAVDRGFVTYSNAAKMKMLGVGSDTLDAHGAVSEPVARQMAEGAVRESDAAVSVAVTGIAGPGGGSDDKPVGLVWFGATGPSGTITVEHRFGDLGREGIRLATVAVALELLLDRIDAA